MTENLLKYLMNKYDFHASCTPYQWVREISNITVIIDLFWSKYPEIDELYVDITLNKHKSKRLMTTTLPVTSISELENIFDLFSKY